METCFRCDLPEKECKCPSWEIQVPFKVTAYLIDCIMDGAMYGCEYWCDYVVAVATDNSRREKDDLCLSELLTRGYNFKMYHDEGRQADEEGRYDVLTIDMMLKGINMYVALHRTTSTEDMDAGECDLAVQYAMFGEIVYG